MMKIIQNYLIFMISFMMIMTIMIMSLPSYYKSMHPLLIMLSLLLTILNISINMNIYNNSNWYSYITFLIMIGGLMILFLYFSSFMNNLMMSIKWNSLKMIPIKMITFMLMMSIMILNYKNIPWLNNFYEIIPLNLIKPQYFYIYSYNKNISTLISMIYLLICLSFIAKICLKKKYMIRKLNL